MRELEGEGLSRSEIARSLGCDRASVHYHIGKKQGRRTRAPNVTAEDLAEMRRLDEKGLSRKKIGAIFNLHPSVITRQLGTYASSGSHRPRGKRFASSGSGTIAPIWTDEEIQKAKCVGPDRSRELYRHFDKAGILLYVGISVSTIQRLRQHKVSHKNWFKDVARIEVEHFANEREARLAETKAIREENPLHNIAGRPSNLVFVLESEL